MLGMTNKKKVIFGYFGILSMFNLDSLLQLDIFQRTIFQNVTLIPVPTLVRDVAFFHLIHLQ